jgi:hypothetical protein
MFRSRWLDTPHLNFMCPFPINYKMVWSQQRGEQTFFAWKPIPPGPQFVALGMFCTTTPDPPATAAMRCVPKSKPLAHCLVLVCSVLIC